MKKKIRILLIGSGVFFSGCSLGPKYHTPSVETPPAYKETGDWKIAQPKDGAIRGKWWEMFNDPQLNKLEEEVNVSNQNIALAAANFAEARALVKQAWSQYFPALTVNPAITRSRQSSNTGQSNSSSGAKSDNRPVTEYTLPFDASYEVDLWGRIRNSVRASASEAQATDADLENTRLTMQAELAIDYYQIRTLDEKRRLLDSTVTAFQDSLKLTQVRRRTGIASEEDVAQAETQLETTKAQATDLGIQRAQFEHAIAVLAGRSPSAFSLPVDSLKTSFPEIPPGIPSELLERRPDIAAAERRVAEANAQIGVARAAFFPAIMLSATGGFTSTSTSSWFSSPSRFWSLGPELAQTLFNGGRNLAVAEQAQAAYDGTVASYQLTVLTAFQQVEDNLSALQILSQEMQQQDNAVRSSEKSLALATSRYKLGIDSYLNVITAQSVLLNNQRAAMDVRMQRETAGIQLIKALGGGWDTSKLK